MIDIRIQSEPFDVGAELARLHDRREDVGAVASFLGVVRAPAEALTLEHYPGMTEAAMQAIATEAGQRWPVHAGIVIHRVGRLLRGEPIILVAVASPHRGAALDACAFLIDWMKTKAPFWKREEVAGDAQWVEARPADSQAADRWNLVGPAGFEPATKPL